MNCGGCNQPLPAGHVSCEVCGWEKKDGKKPKTFLCACGCGKPGTISTAVNGQGQWWNGACWRQEHDFIMPDKAIVERHMTHLRELLRKKA